MKGVRARERRADRQARAGAAVDLNLVSLIDVFTILIFFLLASSTEVQSLATPPGVVLPQARSDVAPRPGVELVVAGQQLLVQGLPVAELSEAGLGPLRAALQSQARPGTPLVVVADRELPWHWLSALMRTAAAAGLDEVSFAVRRQEGR